MNTRFLCSLSFLVVPVAAQDLIIYKFDEPGSAEVINHAQGPDAVASSGVLESNTGSPLTDGRFGSALAGGSTLTDQYNRVRTGWMPRLQPLLGDLTLAFWIRERTASTALTYLSGMSATGGTRVFTGGGAGRGLYCLGVVSGGGNGSAPGDLMLLSRYADIQTLAAANWTHVALVIDSAAATAQWYVNGAPVLLVANVGPARIASNGEFLVGYQGTSNESNYDQDEFLVSKRAYTGAEITALFTGPGARDVPYMAGVTSQCGSATLRSYGGLPVVGNRDYGLELTAAAPGLYVVVMGYQRDFLFHGIPLPLELRSFAPGCWLLTDIDRLRIGRTWGSTVRLPLPIPLTSADVDLHLYAQGAVFENMRMRRTGSGVHASNGLEIIVGR